jgi:hypothetical protein
VENLTGWNCCHTPKHLIGLENPICKNKGFTFLGEPFIFVFVFGIRLSMKSVKIQVRYQIDNQVSAQVRDQVTYQILSQQIIDQIGTQIWNQIGAQVWRISDQVYDTSSWTVWDQVHGIS